MVGAESRAHGARCRQVAGCSRVRSAGAGVEGAECRGGCGVQDAPWKYSGVQSAGCREVSRKFPRDPKVHVRAQVV